MTASDRQKKYPVLESALAECACEPTGSAFFGLACQLGRGACLLRLRRRSAVAWLGCALSRGALLGRCRLALGLRSGSVARLWSAFFRSTLLRRCRLALGLRGGSVAGLRSAFFRSALPGRCRLALGLRGGSVARLRSAFPGRGARLSVRFAGCRTFRFTRLARGMRTRSGRLSRMTLMRTIRLLLVRVLRAAAIGSVAFSGRSSGPARGLRRLRASGTIAGGCGRARLLGRHGRGMVRSSRSLSSYYAASAEYARFCCGGHGGRAVIVRGEQSLVLTGGMLLPNLCCDRRRMLFAGIFFFPGSRAGRDATFTAVEGDMGLVVDDDRLVNVHVGDVDGVHMHHGGVVEERAAAPFAADEAFAAVAESVINAAIEADVRAPVSSVPGIDTVVPSPVARRPKHADGSDHPGAGHPVVSGVIIPSPVTGRPQIAGARTDGLLVNGKRRRADANRDANADSDLR